LLVYRGTAELEVFHPQLTNLNVTALAADATGFWMGTRNHGLRHWHAGQIDSFEANAAGGSTGQSSAGSMAGDLPDDQVEAIAVSGDKVYVGTPLGVEEFDDGRPARLLARNLFVNALFADAGGLTIGTLDEGVRRVALDNGRRRGGLGAGWSVPGEERVGPAEQFLAVDSDGIENGPHTLLAVMRDGVRREQTGGGWAPLVSDLAAGSVTGSVENRAAQLTDGNISALAFDADGQLWVGYFDRGLDILARTGEGSTQHREDDHLFCVNRIALDPRRQTMAVATANGLVLFDRMGKPRQVMTRRDGLIADHVTDVAFTANSTVIATPAGLTFVDGGGARSLYAFQGLVNNHVYALGVRPYAGEGLSGEILAGTLGGVSVLEGEAVERNLTTSNSGLKHNWITAIVPINGPDAAGGWMVGTYGAGVMRLDKDGRFTAMDGFTRSMIVNPNAMLATSNHVLAGTLGNGLWVWSRASGRWSQVTAGLPSENVTALAEHGGEIYVGTENGLVRIAEHLLD
jgi:ligand-binding sensor domain-containing protein